MSHAPEDPLEARTRTRAVRGREHDLHRVRTIPRYAGRRVGRAAVASRVPVDRGCDRTQPGDATPGPAIVVHLRVGVRRTPTAIRALTRTCRHRAPVPNEGPS